MTKTRDLADLGGGFIQAGTGAQQRTVESKLQDVVSVLDFIPESQHAAIKAGTSTYDATADIQSAVTAAQRVYLPAGTYISSSYFNLTKNNLELYGDGDATVLKSTDITTPNVYTLKVSGENCKISNLKIDGNKAAAYPAISQRDGAAIFGGNGTIENVTAVNTVSAGIRIQDGDGSKVINCRTYDCGDTVNRANNTAGFGIIVAVSTNSVVSGNHVRTTNRSGIFIYNSSKATVTCNTVEDAENGIRTDWLPLTLGDMHTAIAGNSVFNTDGDGIRFTGNYVSVTGNTVKGSTGSGAFSNGGFNQTVSGNVFCDNTQYGIGVASSSGNTSNLAVTGNVCKGNFHGIYLNPAAGASFTDFLIADNNCLQSTGSDVRMGSPTVSCTGDLSSNSGTIGFTSLTNWQLGNGQTTGQVITAASDIYVGGADSYLVSGTADILNIYGGKDGQVITLTFAGNSASDGLLNTGNVLLRSPFRYTFRSSIQLVKNYDRWIEVGRSAPPGLTIASASTIEINSGAKVVTVTGTNDITTINGGENLNEVTLVFTGTAAGLGVVDGSNLRLAGNFAYAANSTLKLVRFASNWLEVSRSSN